MKMVIVIEKTFISPAFNRINNNINKVFNIHYVFINPLEIRTL